MTEKRSWFERPIAALCIILALTILSVYIILNSGTQQEGGGEIAYRITMKHYGIDAREMERSIAIPLEDALSAIMGIDRIMSLSENGQVRLYINFRPGRKTFLTREDEYYDAVREAAQRVYETLPSPHKGRN